MAKVRSKPRTRGGASAASAAGGARPKVTAVMSRCKYRRLARCIITSSGGAQILLKDGTTRRDKMCDSLYPFPTVSVSTVVKVGHFMAGYVPDNSRSQGR